MGTFPDSPAPRLGFFGGTFDPPHNGHLEIAQAAIQKAKLDKFLSVRHIRLHCVLNRLFFLPWTAWPWCRKFARTVRRWSVTMLKLNTALQDTPMRPLKR